MSIRITQSAFPTLMHRCLTSILLLSAPAAVNAQALTNNGSTITVTAGGSLTVKGNLTNAAASTVNNTGNLIVSGNTINNGTINAPAASTLRLEGTSAQTLSGTSAINAKAIVVNNPAGIVVNTRLNVDGAMTFNSGIITATNSSAPIAFTANGSVAGTPSDGSHIDGYVLKMGNGSFIYPIGDAAKYQPVGVNLTTNSNGMTARYYAADAGAAPYGTGGASPIPLLYYNKKEYWDLTPATTAAGAVTLYFDSYNNTGITNTADLRVAHKSGGQYLNEGGAATGTTSVGSVTSNSISTFSPFTLGSVATASPLPITLTSFTAKVEGQRTRLEWKTAVEESGVIFSIERSSDGAAFVSIGKLTGKGGNSDYTLYDEQLVVPLAYYRLKAVGNNGNFNYSPLIAVRREVQNGGQITIAPVPAHDKITIATTNVHLTGTTARVLDMEGHDLIRFTLKAIQEIDVHLWPAGNYTLRLADGTILRLTKL